MIELFRFMFFPHIFSWYTGAIWSNLFASIITTGVAFVWGVRKMKKHSNHHHEELMAHVSKIHDHLGIKEK